MAEFAIMLKQSRKLTGNMAKAQSGSGEAAEAFEALGISVTDGNGELRDRNEVFQETIAALGKMTNETERDATAMKIFGRSAQDLNPLILGGAEALQALGDEAAKAGLILSQDDLDALNTVSDAVDRFKATTSAAGNLFMVGFAAPISEAVNLITGYLQQMTAAFTESGWDGLSETMGAILTDIGDKITEYLPKLVSFGADIINRLALGIAKMLPDIAKAAVEIVTTLITGLFETLPELIPTAVDAILTITETLIDNVDHLVDAAVAIVIALANGLIEALPRLIEKAPEIVLKLVNAIIENVPKVLAAARDLIAMLAQGIYENLRAIWDKGVELVREFIAGIASWLFKVTEQGTEIVSKVEDGLRQKVEDAKQWGRDLINNFVAGITSMIQKVKDTVSSVASTVKDFLGFSEPDKGPLSDFHTYGPDMMKLYAGGIRDNAWRVQDALDTAAAGWSARIKEPELSFADVLSGAVSGMQTAVEGIGGGSYSFTLVLPDGTVLARYMLPTLIDVAQANGTPILNPE